MKPETKHEPGPMDDLRDKLDTIRRGLEDLYWTRHRFLAEEPFPSTQAQMEYAADLGGIANAVQLLTRTRNSLPEA